MEKVSSNNIPSIIESVGNGSYLYHFNIEEVTRQDSMDGLSHTGYEYYEVVVWAPLSAKAITQAVMNEMWSKDIEQKYINDYNAAVLGILDSSYIDRYKEFISQRKSIKEQIDIDYNNYIK